MSQIKAVRGVRDILPTETAKWQRLESVAHRTFQAYGYEEMRLPLFERTEVFARSIGEATDIVQKEMYTFDDRGGDSLTLRPEATAGLMRAYIEHGLHVLPKPVKLYAVGPMFRYERPQAGRYRQFHQLDVEALGDDHPALDAEVIAMLVELFRALGLVDRLTLEVNSIGDPADRVRYRGRLQAYLRQNAAHLCAECRDRAERNPLRALDCKIQGCQPVLQGAPRLTDDLSPEAAEHFARVRAYLDALGLTYVVNPRLVRGLDYYVRTTFELTTTHLGAQNAVAGGGRYDGLIKLLGGPPDPGIGFAVGMERVVLLLPELGPEALEHGRPRVFFIPLGDAALRRVLPVANGFRSRGLRVEVGNGTRKLRGELERANKLGVPHAVIVGDDELARDEAIVREMKTGEQRRVPLAALARELATLAGPA
ncbi:MAG: histidine--tRNA ligase [Candidatus Rokuibacteriota bacterium]